MESIQKNKQIIMNDIALTKLLEGFISELKTYGPDNIIVHRRIKECDDKTLKELMKICVAIEKDK